MDWMVQGDHAALPTDFRVLALAMLLAFLLGQVMAWVYMITHSGLSYSRTFVNSLIVMPTIVSLVMMVLSNNLVTAFGMMAVFAIVRFRNILRDTLDTTYVLAVIVIGMACGTQKFSTAIVGALVTSAIMIFLWGTGFGTRHRFDLIVNLHWERPMADLSDLTQVLHRYSFKAYCASQRSNMMQGGTDLSYRLLMRNPEKMEDLIEDLRVVTGVSTVSGIKGEEESEI